MRRASSDDELYGGDRSSAVNLRSLLIAAIVVVGVAAFAFGPKVSDLLSRSDATQGSGSESNDQVPEGNEGSEDAQDSGRVVALKPELPESQDSTDSNGGSSAGDADLSESQRRGVQSLVNSDFMAIGAKLSELEVVVNQNANRRESEQAIEPGVQQQIDDLSSEINALRESVKTELSLIQSQLGTQSSEMEKMTETAGVSDEDRIKAEELSRLRSELVSRIDSTDAKIKRLDAATQTLNRVVERDLPQLRRSLNSRRSEAERQTVQRPQTTSLTESRQLSRDEGWLVIDNNSGREDRIQVNGRSEQLRRGRNWFKVKLGDVEVAIPGGSKSWRLESSLWDRVDGQMVLYRNKWPI